MFSIAMGADYSFYVKFIATRAPTFFGYIISVLASVIKETLVLEAHGLYQTSFKILSYGAFILV